MFQIDARVPGKQNGVRFLGNRLASQRLHKILYYLKFAAIIKISKRLITRTEDKNNTRVDNTIAYILQASEQIINGRVHFIVWFNKGKQQSVSYKHFSCYKY